MALHLSIKSAPEGESTTNPPATNELTFTVPVEDGADPEAVKAAFEELVSMVVRKGARNNKADATRIQEMHDHSKALGAKCDGAAMGKSASTADLAAKNAAGSEEGAAKALPLDTLVNAVRDAFWDLRETQRLAQKPFGKGDDDYWAWDDDECASCIAVYDGYAIARVGLQFFQVPYTVGQDITLAPQAEWTEVEQSFVTKSSDLAALLARAKRRELGAVKSLGGNRLGAYLMLWGDTDHRDLYGEWFTEKTAGLLSIYNYIGKIPALYQHAMDNVVKYTPVGTIDVLEMDEVGLWMEAQLDMANEYAGAVQELARRKALGTSSGALPGSRKALASGEIVQWAIIEGSFTPSPAEPRLREIGVEEVKSIYQELGLELPLEVKTVAEGGEEPRATDEADVEAERLRLLELEALAHS